MNEDFIIGENISIDNYDNELKGCKIIIDHENPFLVPSDFGDNIKKEFEEKTGKLLIRNGFYTSIWKLYIKWLESELDAARHVSQTEGQSPEAANPVLSDVPESETDRGISSRDNLITALQEVFDLQETHYGCGIDTHIELINWVEKWKDLKKYLLEPIIPGQDSENAR